MCGTLICCRRVARRLIVALLRNICTYRLCLGGGVQPSEAGRGETSPFKVLLFAPLCGQPFTLLLLSVCHAGRAARGGHGAAVGRCPSSCPEGLLRREEAALGSGPDRLHGRRLLRQHREKAQLLPKVAGRGKGRVTERRRHMKLGVGKKTLSSANHEA